MKKILITGSSGFLGHHLLNALKIQGHQITAPSSKECDLTKETSLDPFSNQTFDEIFHLAIWTQAGDFCSRHQGDVWVVNQKINTNMLTWWRDKQPQAKLIAMGTSCSYASGHALKEENYLLGLPEESLFAYAMTKRMLYTGLISMQKQFNMEYLYLIPNTLYGAGYHNDGRQLHFIFDLIRKILGAKAGGEPATLWGDGYQKRELVFVEDFVKAMMALVETQKNKIINLSGSEEHTIRHFAELICEEVDYDPSLVQYDTSKYVGAKSKCLDNSLLKSLLPSLKFTPLKEGLKKTLDWYLQTV